MVNGGEIVAVLLDAHLDAHIVLVVEIPRAGVAHHFAIGGFHEHRAFPERFGQFLEAERGEEALTRAHHVELAHALRLDQLGQVIAQIAGAFGGDQRIYVAPFLRPHIAEQIRTDRTVGGLHGVAICLVEPAAHIGVQAIIERFHLAPKPLDSGGEPLGAHVVI